MMKKRIAVLTPVIPPYAGGIGKAALDEAECLAQKHEVVIFTPKYSRVTLTGHRAGEARGDLKINYVRLPRRLMAPRNDIILEEQRGLVKIKYIKPFFSFGNAAVLPNLQKQLKNFDIVYLHYPFFGTAERLFFDTSKYQRKWSKAKELIIRYHMDIVSRGWLKPFFWLHSTLIMPRILQRADKIIISSFDYAKNSNIKNLLAKHPERFQEIPFGVDTEKFKPEPKDSALLLKYGLKESDKILLFVGSLDKAHYFKGLGALLRAAKEFSIQNLEYRAPNSLILNSKYCILVIGDGDLRPHYEKLVKKLGAVDMVSFVGKVSNDDLPKYYNLADVFVFPSIDRSEAFGIALLEAIACGKAVVASNLPGVLTLVQEGKTGFLAEPGNADDLNNKILLALDKFAELGQAGRKIAEEKYGRDLICRKILDTFNIF